MKKITTLALGLALLAGSAATAQAQITVPKVSDDTNTYLYYVQNAGSNNGYYANNAVGTSNVAQFSLPTIQTRLTVKLTKASTEGKYYIVATNLGDDVSTTYIGATGTTDGSAVTYYAESGKTNAEWTISATTNSSAKGYYPLYNIALGDMSWNMYGGGDTSTSKTIKLYKNTDQGSVWNFIPANAATLKALAADVKADVEATTTTASKEAVNTAITAAESATEEDFETLGATLLTAYGKFLYAQKLTTPDLVDGKAYTITSVSKAGAKAYFNYTESEYALVLTTDENNTSYPETAKFICRKVGDTFTFVNNAGKYFIWRGTSGKTGYSDTYNAAQNFTIENATSALTANLGQNWQGTVPDSKYACIKGERMFVVNWKDATTPIFNQADIPYYNDSFSSAVLIEEVSNNNSVTPKEATGIDNVSYLATFSAPYAAVVPEGAKAYYVQSIDESTAKLTAIASGEAIPANTGVLLTVESGDELYVAPATTETVATVSNNKLVATGGSSKTLTADDNAYILAAKNSQVAFYKGTVGTTLASYKAYLPVTTESSAILMNFNGSTTGINAVQADAAAKAPVYDLTGRRVQKTAKGSLYIQGGRKFIAQ